MVRELRILDAAGNRAREALRVMEDVARFGLDDGGLTGTLKSMRHELASVLGQIVVSVGGARGVLESRDTSGDLGTAIEGAGEARREDLAAVAGAAGSRLAEALRTLEEVAKVLVPARTGAESPSAAVSAWERLEALRYAAYEAQRRLVLALAPAARQWRVCVLITDAMCTRHSWREVARLALAGGADCVQLREKSLDSGELLARARDLVEMARGHGASVIVNDRPDIALLAGADGVHLGQTDMGVAEARRLGARPAKRLLIGVSCSTLEQAERATRDGADYLGLGPMFASGTKPKAILAGVGLVRAVVGGTLTGRLPHLAISGITAANVGELVEAGCRGVAVSGAVCSAADPGLGVSWLRSALGGVAGERG